jgi:hypothetical protein
MPNDVTGLFAFAAITREGFNAPVKGKTEAEVIAAVGRPDRASESGPLKGLLDTERTIDPATGKLDSSAVVWLRDGVVERVGF